MARGERSYNSQCKICHTVEKGGRNGLRPNLCCMFERKAGTLPGFAFSDPMKSLGVDWSDRALADYLEDPKRSIPGNEMVFVGIKRQDQLDDVIADLKATR